MRQIVKKWPNANKELHKHSEKGSPVKLWIENNPDFTVASVRHIDNGIRFELRAHLMTAFVETEHDSDTVAISIHSENDMS